MDIRDVSRVFPPVSVKVIPVIVLLVAASSVQAGITIGSGSSISVGSGAMHLGCGNLTNAGVLNLGSGVVDTTGSISNNNQINGDSGLLELGGDWSNSGIFNAETSTVTVVDNCGDGSTGFNDSTLFHNLKMTTSSGKTVLFQSGAMQEIINELVFQGSPGNLLVLRSSIPGQPAFTSLRPVGTQLIDWVDVQDNYASLPFQHIAPDLPAVFNSLDSGRNFRWFLELEVPTLTGLGIIALVTLVLFGASLSRRRYTW